MHLLMRLQYCTELRRQYLPIHPSVCLSTHLQYSTAQSSTALSIILSAYLLYSTVPICLSTLLAAYSIHSSYCICLSTVPISLSTHLSACGTAPTLLSSQYCLPTPQYFLHSTALYLIVLQDWYLAKEGCACTLLLELQNEKARDASLCPTVLHSTVP